MLPFNQNSQDSSAFFNKYQKEVLGLALPTATNIGYVFGGLTGEVAELSLAVEEYINTHSRGSSGDASAAIAEIKSELGDCWWFISMCLTLMDFNLGQFLNDNADEINSSYTTFAESDFDIKKPDDIGKLILVLFLAVKTSSLIAGAAAKVIRDDDSIFSVRNTKRINYIISNLKVLVAYLSMVHDVADIEVETAMSGNLDKLFSRRDRGVLKGDGGSR